MNVLSDSFSVLVEHWQLVSGIVFILLLGQILVWSVLKMILGNRLSRGAYYSLSLAGWMLPISLASMIWLALGIFQAPAFSSSIVIILTAVLALILFLKTRGDSLPGSRGILLVLLLLFGVFSFLRLAFVSGVLIPQYFDSAQHYLLTRNLLNSTAGAATNYYHLGFHLLTALMVSGLRADIVDVILILGQIILVTIPLAVFFVIRHETGSSSAGIFAVLLATVGWYMPAYAVNWGKYPALTSLTLITFTFSLAYLSARYRNVLPTGKYWALNTILLLAILISGFTHSRSFIVLGIAALAWAVAAWWQTLSRVWRSFFFFTVIAGISLEIGFIRTENVFSLLFDPYWNQGLFVTVIVLFLSIFALWAYPKLTFSAILAVLLLLGSLFIPVTVPGYGNLTLLDRPFVEMVLYLPLALIGGAGLAGLEQSVRQIPARSEAVRLLSSRTSGILFSGLILINALSNYTLYPSDCCSIVGSEDLAAIDWVDKNLPSEARILISSTELRVLATESPQGSVSGDAGAWIHPLTDRATLFLPYHIDFTQQTTLDTLCQMQAEYIFVGETGLSFDSEQLLPASNWYKILLSMPKAQVYQVIGCS